MKTLLFLIGLLIAASFTGFGQRSNTPRPRPVPPAQPASPAPETSAAAQTYKPAIEYQSFMQLRFYENQGGFLVEDLEVVFPPSASRRATFVVTRKGGGEVASVPLRLEAPLASYTAFGRFLPNGVPGNVNIGEPGDYVLSVHVDGQPITTLPFSMKREQSSDPFNPKTAFVREGPWRDLAYFSNRPEVHESHLEFSWWTSLRELPPGSPPRSLVTVHILYGGLEIGSTRSPAVVSQTDWQFLYHEAGSRMSPKTQSMPGS